MGEYLDEQRLVKHQEIALTNFVLETVKIKNLCGIPFIYVKKNKIKTTHLLLNIIPIYTHISYEDFN